MMMIGMATISFRLFGGMFSSLASACFRISSWRSEMSVRETPLTHTKIAPDTSPRTKDANANSPAR